MIMRNGDLIWKTIDRKRAEFIPWARREFNVALTRQFQQYKRASQGASVVGDLMRGVDAITDQPIWDALLNVYERVAGTFAVDAERKLKHTHQFRMKDRVVSDYQNGIRAYVLENSAQNVTAMEQTSKNTLKTIIQRAFDEGLSIPETQRLIEAKFTDMAKIRSERIARTEVVGASNYGALVGAKGTGLSLMKVWISTKDKRTRLDHEDAEGTAVEIDAQFPVGGDMLDFPGDQNGSPGNVINCRCTVVFEEKPNDIPVDAYDPIDAVAPVEPDNDFLPEFVATRGSAIAFEAEYKQAVIDIMRDLGLKGKITIQFEKMRESTKGAVDIVQKAGSKEWTMGRIVHMNDLNTNAQNLSTLRHEIRHVWQGATDKFVIKQYGVPPREWFFWDGQPYMTYQQFSTIVRNLGRGNNYAKYRAFPWEVDARKYQGVE
jgi:hypothetical protein